MTTDSTLGIDGGVEWIPLILILGLDSFLFAKLETEFDRSCVKYGFINIYVTELLCLVSSLRNKWSLL